MPEDLVILSFFCSCDRAGLRKPWGLFLLIIPTHSLLRTRKLYGLLVWRAKAPTCLLPAPLWYKRVPSFPGVGYSKQMHGWPCKAKFNAARSGVPPSFLGRGGVT